MAQFVREINRLRDKDAYWPRDRWEVDSLEGKQLAHLRSMFDEQFWSTIPAVPSALEACHRLVNKGYELVCVTALPFKFRDARLHNLQELKFPIQNVIATTDEICGGVSPKAAAIQSLGAVAFVDDFLPYHQGIVSDTHLALVTREPNGTPNVGDGLKTVHSTHKNLEAFASHWLHSQKIRPGLKSSWASG